MDVEVAGQVLEVAESLLASEFCEANGMIRPLEDGEHSVIFAFEDEPTARTAQGLLAYMQSEGIDLLRWRWYTREELWALEVGGIDLVPAVVKGIRLAALADSVSTISDDESASAAERLGLFFDVWVRNSPNLGKQLIIPGIADECYAAELESSALQTFPKYRWSFRFDASVLAEESEVFSNGPWAVVCFERALEWF